MAQHAHKRQRASSDSNKSSSDGGGGGKPRHATAAAATTPSLLTPALLREAHEAWCASHSTTATTSSSSLSLLLPAEVVPEFRVGTHEMYKHHARAYEALMQRHDCSALRRHLVDEVLARIVRTHTTTATCVGNDDNNAVTTAAPLSFVRVADVGCGTGRIAGMLVQHPAVQAVYAYDNAPAMLQRGVVHTVRCAAAAAHCDGVVLSTSNSDDDEAHVVQLTSSADSPPSSQQLPSRRLLQLHVCVRSYEDLCTAMCSSSSCSCSSHDGGCDGVAAQQQTSLPRCQLVVCAWSLSYVMRRQWGGDRWHDAVDATVRALRALLDCAEGDAAVVVIETLGTDTVEPTRQNTLMQRLEQHHGFVRSACVRTDYTFASVDEAVRLTRFFYGATRANALRARSATVLRECTGVWTLWQSRVVLHKHTASEQVLLVSACPCMNLLALVSRTRVALYRSTTHTPLVTLRVRTRQRAARSAANAHDENDSNSNNEEHTRGTIATIAAAASAAVCAAWSPSGRFFALALPDGGVWVLDVERALLVRRLVPCGMQQDNNTTDNDTNKNNDNSGDCHVEAAAAGYGVCTRAMAAAYTMYTLSVAYTHASAAARRRCGLVQCYDDDKDNNDNLVAHGADDAGNVNDDDDKEDNDYCDTCSDVSSVAGDGNSNDDEDNNNNDDDDADDDTRRKRRRGWCERLSPTRLSTTPHCAVVAMLWTHVQQQQHDDNEDDNEDDDVDRVWLHNETNMTRLYLPPPTQRSSALLHEVIASLHHRSNKKKKSNSARQAAAVPLLLLLDARGVLSVVLGALHEVLRMQCVGLPPLLQPSSSSHSSSATMQACVRQLLLATRQQHYSRTHHATATRAAHGRALSLLPQHALYIVVTTARATATTTSSSSSSNDDSGDVVYEADLGARIARVVTRRAVAFGCITECCRVASACHAHAQLRWRRVLHHRTRRLLALPQHAALLRDAVVEQLTPLANSAAEAAAASAASASASSSSSCAATLYAYFVQLDPHRLTCAAAALCRAWTRTVHDVRRTCYPHYDMALALAQMCNTIDDGDNDDDDDAAYAHTTHKQQQQHRHDHYNDKSEASCMPQTLADVQHCIAQLRRRCEAMLPRMQSEAEHETDLLLWLRQRASLVQAVMQAAATAAAAADEDAAAAGGASDNAQQQQHRQQQHTTTTAAVYEPLSTARYPALLRTLECIARGASTSLAPSLVSSSSFDDDDNDNKDDEDSIVASPHTATQLRRRRRRDVQHGHTYATLQRLLQQQQQQHANSNSNNAHRQLVFSAVPWSLRTSTSSQAARQPQQRQLLLASRCVELSLDSSEDGDHGAVRVHAVCHDGAGATLLCRGSRLVAAAAAAMATAADDDDTRSNSSGSVIVVEPAQLTRLCNNNVGSDDDDDDDDDDEQKAAAAAWRVVACRRVDDARTLLLYMHATDATATRCDVLQLVLADTRHTNDSNNTTGDAAASSGSDRAAVIYRTDAAQPCVHVKTTCVRQALHMDVSCAREFAVLVARERYIVLDLYDDDDGDAEGE